MLHAMREQFDTVSFYSMSMLVPGMIVYYLKPYTLGLDQDDQGCGTAKVGGRRFDARVHLKGRFGIIVDKHMQSLNVAEIYSFGKKGLSSKKPGLWREYVGLRTGDHEHVHKYSPHGALEVAKSTCEIIPESTVHLVTDKISLSNQIILAGYITTDSLQRLKTLIREVEKVAEALATQELANALVAQYLTAE